MDQHAASRRGSLSRTHAGAESMFEHLEARVLLSNTPMPDLTKMVDKNNTIVRIETSMGTIDLEMFDVAAPDGAPPAPKTVENFLKHLRAGDYDLSFIHRYARIDDPGGKLDGTPFVIQGGGFKFTDDEGLFRIPGGDPIKNEFHPARSNKKMTLSMARLGGDQDSATTEWFINLRNNNSGKINLDDDRTIKGEGDGYCVFGKVLDKRSWDVVVAIQGLTQADFRDFKDPLKGALNEVPIREDIDVFGEDGIRGTEDDVPLSEDLLVIVSNAEIIKPANTSSFYRLREAYPEGYRGPATIETLELVNPDTDNPNYYQVIVRYERGMGRDAVIATGTIEPNAHLTIRVCDFNDPNLNLVQEGAPYAFEVWATAPLGAALNHFDLGAHTSESFVNIDQSLEQDLQVWGFGGTATTIDSPKDPDIVRRPYLVWQNLSFEPAEVTIIFTLHDGSRARWVRHTDPLRRDGLEVFSLRNVPRDFAGIRVTSDKKIVAALTVYDTLIDRSVQPPGSTPHGFTAAGAAGGGLRKGVLAGAWYGDEGEAYATFTNESMRKATVTLRFIRSDDTVTTAQIEIGGRGRYVYNLRKTGIPAGEFFTITYDSAETPISAQYISTINGDSVSTPFSTRGASQSIFADGRYNPDNPDEAEVISIYNPYTLKDVKVSIIFHFADDKIQGLPQFDLKARGRLDISVASLNAIVSKIRSGDQFKLYGIQISVSTEGGTGGSLGAAGVVAMLTRYNLTEAITTASSPHMFVLPLDSPSFNAA